MGERILVVMETCDYSESQSLSDSTAALSDEEGEGGSGGSSSCIRYLSFIQGLTSSWRGGRKTERKRVWRGEGGRGRERYINTAWRTQISYGTQVFTSLPYLEVIQGMESVVRVLSLTRP